MLPRSNKNPELFNFEKFGMSCLCFTKAFKDFITNTARMLLLHCLLCFAFFTEVFLHLLQRAALFL